MICINFHKANKTLTKKWMTKLCIQLILVHRLCNCIETRSPPFTALKPTFTASKWAVVRLSRWSQEVKGSILTAFWTELNSNCISLTDLNYFKMAEQREIFAIYLQPQSLEFWKTERFYTKQCDSFRVSDRFTTLFSLLFSSFGMTRLKTGVKFAVLGSPLLPDGGSKKQSSSFNFSPPLKYSSIACVLRHTQRCRLTSLNSNSNFTVSKRQRRN